MWPLAGSHCLLSAPLCTRSVQTTLTTGGVPHEQDRLGGNSDWHKRHPKQDITNLSISAFRKRLGAHNTAGSKENKGTNVDWDCVKLGGMFKKKHFSAYKPAPHNFRSLSSSMQMCSAHSKVMNPMGDVWGLCIRLYRSSKTLQPLWPYTCRVIMRTSHEPSQEIIFSLKSPEQVSLPP